VVGIDVAKAGLDVHLLPAGEAFAVARDAAGLDALIARLRPLAPAMVAIEATGGLESVVAAGLGAPACRSWWSIRRRFGLRPFAGEAGEEGFERCASVSEGVIAGFAVATRPTIRPLADAEIMALANLIARRRQITQMPNPRKEWGRGAAREAGVEADEEDIQRLRRRRRQARGRCGPWHLTDHRGVGEQPRPAADALRPPVFHLTCPQLRLVPDRRLVDISRMRKVIWSIFVLVLLGLGLLLHWTLPSRDVVRILGTDVVRQQAVVSNERGEDITRSRDIRYINAVTPGGSPRVYRNEDTGWGWPPYFKFNTANVAAEAQNMASTGDNPRWVIVRHYGWRIPLFSAFPNALSIEPADGPDQTLVPWLKIAVLVLLLGVAAYLWWWLHRMFRERDEALG
jgi:hypothetical protein